MRIDTNILNTLPRAYQTQRNQEAIVAEPNPLLASNSIDEVAISAEAYLKAQEAQAPSSIESLSEITPDNPLPDDPDNPGSTGGNP